MTRLTEWRERRGLTKTELARRVHTSGSQIGHLESGRRQMTETWLLRLAQALDVSPADLIDPTPAPPPLRGPGFADVDVSPLPASFGSADLATDLAALLAPRCRAPALWRVHSRALEDLGYLPGDLILLDLGRDRPDAGDVVVAQLYDWTASDARTLLRLYEPPYLVAACRDRTLLTPHRADADGIAVKGIAVACIRCRLTP